MRRLKGAVLDEVQRVPEILLALKRSVDFDPTPGRFLLTGSADLMTLPTVADSLAGRMENIRLLPLSQAEIQGFPSTFLETVFSGELPTPTRLALGDQLIARVLQGGFPEAIKRSPGRRRTAWVRAYLESVLGRDVQDIATVEQLGAMPSLVQSAAAYAAQLVNYTKLGSNQDLTYKTTQRYVQILQQLYVIAQLPAWSHNLVKRAVRAPKLHFIDTGILGVLQGLDAKVLQNKRQLLGPILENFVFSELIKLVGLSAGSIRMFHYRDKNGDHEVDIVLEGPGGRIVGIEVKASSSAEARDFSGLIKLAKASGKNFVLGVLLHDHDVIVPFGDKMFSAPVSCLWH